MLTKSEILLIEAVTLEPKIHDAAVEYRKLQDRTMHPDGKKDNAGRFFLSCKLSCCNVRTPSRAYPYSEMIHGRSIKHVAVKWGLVDKETQVRAYARLCKKYPFLESGSDRVEALYQAHLFAITFSKKAKDKKIIKAKKATSHDIGNRQKCMAPNFAIQ